MSGSIAARDRSVAVDRRVGPFPPMVEGIEPTAASGPGRRGLEADAAARRPEGELATDRDEGGVSVSGSLCTTAGQPIVGERVYLSSLDQRSHHSVTSDDRGVFAFPRVPPDDRYRLAITPSARYRKLSIDPLSVHARMPPVDLVLDEVAVGRIGGSVVDSHGLAASNFAMVIYSAEPGIASMKVRTDATGFFVADDVAAGLVTFAIRAPAYVPIHTLWLEGGDRVDVGIVLGRRWHSLRGKVIDDEGGALGGVALHLYRPDTEPAGGADRWIRSGADGSFSFHALSIPPYELVAETPGFRPSSQTIETTDDYIAVYLDPTP